MPRVDVLLVDDRPENLLALEAMLDGLDVNLVKATSGEAALRRLMDHDFAVILLDVQMQGMNGFETAQLIKDRERSAHIPIIFLTGLDASDVQIFRGYSLGAVDYLVKPIVPEILRAKVTTFVELFVKSEEVRQQAQQIDAINQELTRQIEEIQRLHRNVDEQKRATQEQQQLLIHEQTARAAAEAVQQRMAFLAQASAVLSSSLDYETTLTNVTRLVVPEIADWCAVDLVEEDGSVRQLAVQHSDPSKVALLRELQERYPPDVNARNGVYNVLRTGEPELYSVITEAMLATSVQDDEHLRLLRQLGFVSAMIVPFKAGGQILGALTFSTAESGRHYSTDDLQLAQDLASRSALAVENARLYRQMSRQREHLEVTLTSIGDAVITTDAQGQVTLINAVAEALTGYSWDEAIGKDITEIFNIINEETRQPVENPLMLVFREGRIVGLANHTLLIAKDGTERPIDDSGAPIRDEQDNIVGAILVFRDITERKRADTLQSFLVNASAVLASSFDYEATLKQLTELIVPILADWCVIVVLQDGGQPETAYIVYSIPTKRPVLDTIGQKYPFDPDGPSGISHVLRTGQALFLPEIDPSVLATYAYDEKHQELAGQLGTTSAMIVPILARGRVLGSISFHIAESKYRYTHTDLEIAEELAQRAAIAIDNARLYRDTQQARQSAEWAAERTTRLQVITALLSGALTPEQVSDVILEQGLPSLGAAAGSVALLDDEKQNLRIVSAAGYPQGSVDPWQTFAIEEKVPLAEAVNQKAPVWISSAALWKERYPQLAANDSVFSEAAWAALPLVVEGQAIGALGLSFSQSREFSPDDQGFMLALAHHCAQAVRRALLFEAERKAVGEAQAALRIRDEFLSVAAHELKTPITSLRGFSQATLRQLERNTSFDMKRVARALHAIDQQSAKLTKLVSQLLDISRLEGGRLALDRQLTDVTALVEGIANQAQINTKRHTITVNARPNIQAQVDAMRLEQVVTNLIDNAIKYSPEGGPVWVEVSLEADGSLAIRVTDRGLGIAPEHREKIFERFYQAHKISVQGMGLGLYISRQIVHLHGGTISAEFPQEGGSSFIVCIPPEPIEESTNHR